MGVFQKGINNLLGEVAVVSKVAGDELKKAKIEKANKEKAEMEEQKATEESIKETTNAINDALQMSVGYTAQDLQKQKAREDLGLPSTGKMPRGVSKQTYERRMANAEAQRKILTQFVQDKDFRERISKYSTKDLSGALNPEVRSRKKVS